MRRGGRELNVPEPCRQITSTSSISHTPRHAHARGHQCTDDVTTWHAELHIGHASTLLAKSCLKLGVVVVVGLQIEDRWKSEGKTNGCFHSHKGSAKARVLVGVSYCGQRPMHRWKQNSRVHAWHAPIIAFTPHPHPSAQPTPSARAKLGE